MKAFGCVVLTTPVAHIKPASVVRRTACNCSKLSDDGGISFSYQKRSEFRKFANCNASRHDRVGPKTVPGAESSDRAPASRSTSAASR